MSAKTFGILRPLAELNDVAFAEEDRLQRDAPLGVRRSRNSRPYAFASHFAPATLQRALSAYRTEFQPSERLDRPYVMVGVNVLAADTTAAANAQLKSVSHARAVGQFVRQFGLAGPDVSDEQADEIPAAGAAPHVDESLTYTAAGTPSDVRDSLDPDPDELISVHSAPIAEDRLRSIALLAEAAH